MKLIIATDGDEPLAELPDFHLYDLSNPMEAALLIDDLAELLEELSH